MDTGFEPNTLGEAFVLKIRKDYEDEMKSANPIKLDTGNSLYTDVLPFLGIEQVSPGLAENWQFFDIPICPDEKPNDNFFVFPEHLDWDKYKPDWFVNPSGRARYFCNFGDYLEDTITLAREPLVYVKARGRIYIIRLSETKDYLIESFKEKGFVTPPHMAKGYCMVV